MREIRKQISSNSFFCFIRFSRFLNKQVNIVCGNKTTASIGPDDIAAFRVKNEKIVINELNDLNKQSEDVKGIFRKIDELRKKGYDMLNDVPAQKRTCAIKVKHRVDVIMERATVKSDQCIASNVEAMPSHEINVRRIKAKRIAGANSLK